MQVLQATFTACLFLTISDLGMLISEYAAHVKKTDKSVEKSQKDRIDIAIYGLNAEIGSVVSAVKKSLLTGSYINSREDQQEELSEELGDVIWYCFSLSQTVNFQKPINIFNHDIANLRKEIRGRDTRAQRIRQILNPEKQKLFLELSSSFPVSSKKMVFEQYQKISLLTARTEGRTLVEVCLAVLWQLGAQLFRHTLPTLEMELNKSLVHRSINDLLGEIAWHISALASVYNLNLSTIAKKNVLKTSQRFDRSAPTPLHDEDCRVSEKFPRKFQVLIISVGEKRSRMYYNGVQLGDDLTDNSYEEDGYRYHDIMHLANAAKLGWSPVLRSLMGLKRKSNQLIDEVEDGARSKIVEEAIIKSIHAEGARVAKAAGPLNNTPALFLQRSEISFKFLQFIRNLTADLEVYKNRFWEWEDAILAGHKIFANLRKEGQGTISIDLSAREISFSADVNLEIRGKVVGAGSIFVETASESDPKVTAKLVDDGQKRAVLAALGINEPSNIDLEEILIKDDINKSLVVRAFGRIQRIAWQKQVVAFKVSTSLIGGFGYYCSALALSDE